MTYENRLRDVLGLIHFYERILEDPLISDESKETYKVELERAREEYKKLIK